MILSADGLVLRALRYGDTSLILTVFTREQGKIGLMAKGARSPRAPFGSALEPFTRTQFHYYHKAGRDLQLLSKAEVLDRWKTCAESGERILAGFALLELLDATTPREEPNEDLFALVVQSLDLLDAGRLPPDGVLAFFLLHLVTALGFHLDLEGCLLCRGELLPQPALAYLPEEGGFLCPSCASARNARNIPTRIVVSLALLRDLPDTPIETDPREWKQGQELLLRYLRHHIPELREIRSLRLSGLFS